ncbi:MAG: YfiR family protein [Colwellia sp.]
MFQFKYLLLFTAFILATSISYEAIASDREYTLKAGFMYNFARYSVGDWFNLDENESYNICSTDEDFVRVAKQTLSKQYIKEHPVKISYINTPENGCHTLFITDIIYHPLINHNAFSKTMLVGQTPGVIDFGGHINFFIAGGKVRFEVSPSNLQKAGIKLSSKVLRMGRIVAVREDL